MLAGLLARRWCNSPKAFVYVKFAERKPGLDKGQGLLTLHDSAPPYYPLCTTEGIKAPLKNKVTGLAHQAWSPRVILFSFSLFFSLCSSFRMTTWNTGALWVHFFAWASKTRSVRRPASSLGRGHPASSPHWEGACGLCEQSKFHIRSFIGFLCKPRKIKPLSLPFYFPYCRHHPPEGIPGSYRGWTLVSGAWTRLPKVSLPQLCNFSDG